VWRATSKLYTPNASLNNLSKFERAFRVLCVTSAIRMPLGGGYGRVCNANFIIIRALVRSTEIGKQRDRARARKFLNKDTRNKRNANLSKFAGKCITSHLCGMNNINNGIRAQKRRRSSARGPSAKNGRIGKYRARAVREIFNGFRIGTEIITRHLRARAFRSGSPVNNGKRHTNRRRRRFNWATFVGST